jgi:polyferredoxin
MVLGGCIFMRRIILLSILIILVTVMLTGCVPGDGTYTADNQAGFFWGVWHGWIAPVSLIWGLFNKNINIYEVVNSGWWYDFGFYIAIISGFGGLSLVRRKNSNRNNR